MALGTRPSHLLFPGRESSRLRNDFKSLPFLKLIKLLLYDPLFLWLPCVIYEHLEILTHKKDNIVEAEMQLIMWCCKEAGRGWGELLHQARQLRRSEMQGRKDESFEEMQENRKKCEWILFHWVNESTSLYTRCVPGPEHHIVPHCIQPFKNPLAVWGFGPVVSRLALQPLNTHFQLSWKINEWK